MSKPLVIGLGNYYRGDDAIGLLVAEALAAENSPDCDVALCEGEGTRLLELWSGRPTVILVDAVLSGSAPGQIYRFDALAEPLPVAYFQATSSHSLDLVTALELGRLLGNLPDRLLVYGIEAANFELGTSPQPAVKAALPLLLQELKSGCRDRKVAPTESGFSLIPNSVGGVS